MKCQYCGHDIGREHNGSGCNFQGGCEHRCLHTQEELMNQPSEPGNTSNPTPTSSPTGSRPPLKFSGDKNHSHKKFLEQLEKQYDKDLQWKDSLDNKSDKMITMSSALATLMIGLGTFLVSRIASMSWLYLVDIFLLMVGVLLAALAIALFINAFKIRNYTVAFGAADSYFPNVKRCGKKVRRNNKFPWIKREITKANADAKEICEDKLTEENLVGYLDRDRVGDHWKLDEDLFTETAIVRYLRSIKLNGIVFDTKAKWIRRGQWFFLSSIISISLVLLATLIGIYFGIPISETNGLDSNELPISNAGSDQVVIENETVALDGSESRDRDGTIFSYLWNQTSGLEVDLSDESDLRPTFKAPDITNATEFRFKLSVTDNRNDTTEDTVSVIVKNDTLQDESTPIVCSRVIPRLASNQVEKADLFTIATNQSYDEFFKGTVCGPRRGSFDETSKPMIFVNLDDTNN